jgi:hypothetical protein
MVYPPKRGPLRSRPFSWRGSFWLNSRPHYMLATDNCGAQFCDGDELKQVELSSAVAVSAA